MQLRPRRGHLVLGWIRRVSEKSDRRFEKINIIDHFYHHLSTMTNLQKVNCKSWVPRSGEIKSRGKKICVVYGEACWSGPKVKGCYEGIEDGIPLSKKSKRVYLFIQTRGSPVWHCYEDQAGGHPQCHATSVKCTCSNFHNTSCNGNRRVGCTELTWSTYHSNRIPVQPDIVTSTQ